MPLIQAGASSRGSSISCAHVQLVVELNTERHHSSKALDTPCVVLGIVRADVALRLVVEVHHLGLGVDLHAGSAAIAAAVVAIAIVVVVVVVIGATIRVIEHELAFIRVVEQHVVGHCEGERERGPGCAACRCVSESEAASDEVDRAPRRRRRCCMVSLSRSLASVAWLPLPTMPRRRCSRSTNPSIIIISNNNYNGVATRVRLLVLVVAMVVVALAAPSEQVNVYMPDQTELVHLDAAVGVFAKQQVTDNTPASAFYDEGYEHGVTTLLLQSTYRDQDAGATGNAGKRYQWDHEFIDPPHVSIVGVWETAGDDEELRQHLRLLPSGSMSTKELELQLAGEAVTPLTFPDVRSHRQGHALDLQYIDGADSIPYLNVVYVCKVPLSKLLIRLAYVARYTTRYTRFLSLTIARNTHTHTHTR